MSCACWALFRSAGCFDASGSLRDVLLHRVPRALSSCLLTYILMWCCVAGSGRQ